MGGQSRSRWSARYCYGGSNSGSGLARIRSAISRILETARGTEGSGGVIVGIDAADTSYEISLNRTAAGEVENRSGTFPEAQPGHARGEDSSAFRFERHKLGCAG